MKLFYLIGDSIDQSLSPYIHSWIYKFLDIDADYNNKKISVKNFDKDKIQLFSNLINESIHGLNITNPYKERIISNDITISEDANKICAVNCLYKDKNNLIGENTDWIGFIQSIDNNKVDLTKYNIKVIGAGGAAKAIIYGLQRLDVKRIEIYNRTKKKLLINNQEYYTYDIDEFGKKMNDNVFVINCIESNKIQNILNDDLLKSVLYFYDLNYHRNNFHNLLEGKDIKVILGLDMLIYQAIKSVEIWLKFDFANKIDIKEIKNYLKNKSLC